jgi:hypothetical protein
LKEKRESTKIEIRSQFLDFALSGYQYPDYPKTSDRPAGFTGLPKNFAANGANRTEPG